MIKNNQKQTSDTHSDLEQYSINFWPKVLNLAMEKCYLREAFAGIFAQHACESTGPRWRINECQTLKTRTHSIYFSLSPTLNPGIPGISSSQVSFANPPHFTSEKKNKMTKHFGFFCISSRCTRCNNGVAGEKFGDVLLINFILIFILFIQRCIRRVAVVVVAVVQLRTVRRFCRHR